MSALVPVLPPDRPLLSEDLYREFQPLVFGVCYRFLGTHRDAEDATGEIFVRLPRALKTFDRRQPFSRWLSTVVGHYCLDILRRRHVERRIFQSSREAACEPVAHELSPLQELEAHERTATVRAAVAALPARYRTPLVLRYYQHLTYNEIANRLGLTLANVRSLIFRAKRQLRVELAGSRARKTTETVDATLFES
jgi:RNA polymerase sigma-70 factor, ECF subfamily